MESSAAAVTLASFLADVGTFFTSALSWLGDALDVVVANPPLMVMVLGIPIAGVAIGFLSRLIRL